MWVFAGRLIVKYCAIESCLVAIGEYWLLIVPSCNERRAGPTAFCEPGICVLYGNSEKINPRVTAIGRGMVPEGLEHRAQFVTSLNRTDTICHFEGFFQEAKRRIVDIPLLAVECPVSLCRITTPLNTNVYS